MGELRVAACNVIARPVAGFDGFAAHMRSLLDRAREAELVVLPEYVTLELALGSEPAADGGGSRHAELAGHTDAYRELFRAEAVERGQSILAGSHPVIERGAPLNLAHLFLPDGGLRTHAKTHVVAGELADGVGEGEALEPVELPAVTAGIAVCYEAEFPECAATLVEGGAELLLCPSLTHSEHGFWRVRHCLHARCVEHQVYAVHAGLGAEVPESIGGAFAASAVLSPCDAPWPADGVLAASEPNREQVVTARLDLEALEESRRSCPAPTYRDRRRRAHVHVGWRSGGALASGEPGARPA
jgi:predicted amidohydrolase